jgi:biopolymer transport protein ExbD
MLGALLPVPGLPLQLPAAAMICPARTNRAWRWPLIPADGFILQTKSSAKHIEIDLANAAKNSREPLTLVIHADKSVTYEQLVRLTMVARDAGIQNVLLATLPRVISTPDQP